MRLTDAFLIGSYLYVPRNYAYSVQTEPMLLVGSFIGYSNINYALSEVKHPVKTLKRALPICIIIIAILYLLVNSTSRDLSVAYTISETLPSCICGYRLESNYMNADTDLCPVRRDPQGGHDYFRPARRRALHAQHVRTHCGEGRVCAHRAFRHRQRPRRPRASLPYPPHLYSLL